MVENDIVKLELVNNIVYLTYKKGLKINIDMAKQVVVTRLLFQSSKTYPLLIHDAGVISMDKNARDYFSSEEGCIGIIASALILKSVFSTFLGNFFLSITKPKIPVKIFTNENDALEWMNKYKTNE